MNKLGEFLQKLYFTLVATITLFLVIFGAIDILSIGLKTYVFKAADVPEHIEKCAGLAERLPAPDGSTKEERVQNCEARNATAIENYKRSKARDAVRDLAIVLVTLPLFILHFRAMINGNVKKRKKKKEKKQ